MTLRFSTSRAIGAAIALTLGSAAAGAQTPVRKDVPPSPAPSRMPVTKDNTPAPAPAPDTTTSMPAPAPAPAPAPVMTDTMTSTTTTTTTTVSTGEVPAAPMRSLGSNWYIGVAGAAEFPQNRLNDFYRTGYGVEGQLGWQPQSSPLGLRLNVGYARMRGDANQVFYNGATRITSQLADPQIIQGVVDAKLRLPIGNFLSGLYAVGGGGVYYFKNYVNTLGITTNPGTTGTVGQGSTGGSVTNTFSSSDATRFGANIGGGVSFGVGSAALFVESRYVRVFTPNTDTDYVPVALGVTFHW